MLLSLLFLTRSNLRFPSQRGLPFGLSQIGFSLCFSPFSVTCLGLSPLRSSVLFASGVLCVSFSPGGFFFLGSPSRPVLLPSRPFLVPPGSCGFRPFWLFLAVVPLFLSSVSPSFQFSVPLLLDSSPPFRWWFSLSLPWPFLLSLALFPAPSPSVCGLSCSGPSFHGWVVSFLFLCVPSFHHEVFLCCFSSFRLSAFQDSLPSSVVSFLFIPPDLELPFVSALFRWALLRLSCLPSCLVCFTIGLLFSLLVPGFSFLLFPFSLCFFLLVPSFPPFSRWSSFSCLASARLVRVLWAVSYVVSSVVLSLTSLCSGVFACRLRLLCSSFSFLDLF